MLELLQQQFTTLIERRAFEPIRRFMTPVDQDDRLAEGIAMTWSLAARKAGLVIKMDNALLVHAVKLRAVDHRRQLPRGGQPRRDALHLANYLDGRVVVHRLDGPLDEDGEHTGEGDAEIQAAWLAATSLDPAEQLASTVDLQGWLGSLPAGDQALLAARYMGKTLTEIGAAAGMSPSVTCTRLRALGGDLAARAGIRVRRRTRRARAAGAQASAASAA